MTVDLFVVDADAHCNENPTAWEGLEEKRPGWLEFAEDDGKPVAKIEGKLYPRQSGPGRGVPIDSSINQKVLEGAFVVEQRLADMDTDGIDVQVLYGGLSIGVGSFDDAGFARDFAQAYNDWLLDDICATDPKRLKGVCVVPLQDTGLAVEELRRAHGKGACAVVIPPVVGDRNLDDPTVFPFFEAAAALDVGVGIHSAPGMNNPLPAADRFDNYVQVHMLSFPVDQMVAFTALAAGGVFDRLPDLRVVFLEAGTGWVPYFIDRAHEHKEKRGDLTPGWRTDPAELVARGQCWFTFEAEDPFLGHYVEHLGADSVMFASDYPHWDCEFPGAVEEARENAADVDETIVAKVMGENAQRFYRL